MEHKTKYSIIWKVKNIDFKRKVAGRKKMAISAIKQTPIRKVKDEKDK